MILSKSLIVSGKGDHTAPSVPKTLAAAGMFIFTLLNYEDTISTLVTFEVLMDSHVEM